MKKRIIKVAISGVKNSGKTSLIERMIPFLNEKGLRVAVIKHDGHDFEADVPGTDSYRARKAGAYGTAVFSAKKYLAVKDTEHANEKELEKLFPEADLILLEGFKYSEYPKLEIVRNGNSEESVANQTGLLAVVSDFEPRKPEGIPVLNLNDVNGIAEFLADYVKEQQKKEIEGEHHAYGKIMVKGEEYFFGPGVYQLLRRVEKYGSIRQAAAEINLSYTKACKMLKRAEEGSSIVFLERKAGGKTGGMSVLTKEGLDYLDKYQQMLEETDKAIEEIYQRFFGEMHE